MTHTFHPAGDEERIRCVHAVALEGEGRTAPTMPPHRPWPSGMGCATGAEVPRMSRSPHPAHSRQSSALPQMVDPPPSGEGKKETRQPSVSFAIVLRMIDGANYI